MTTPSIQNRLKQRLFWFYFVAWLLPALACNFPGTNKKPVEMTSKELHQTLAAQLAVLPTLSTQIPPTTPPRLETRFQL
jgi:hypothetical protein